MPSIDLHLDDSTTWCVDTDAPVELAVPLQFDGDQPRAFSLPTAEAEVVEADGFVGDRRRGGTVNCETVHITPHGNGTHTEGVGHITEERIPVGDAAPEPLLPAVVLTASPRVFDDTEEDYDGVSTPEDTVVCRADLRKAFDRAVVPDTFTEAVIIRLAGSDPTPGDHADYSGTNPPYLTDEAVDWLCRIGCDHLLVELPSIDRESDGGTVPNHHRFFGLEPGEEADDENRRRTVTEMISVPDRVDDGPWALSLRFPRFVLDAAPSRPVLYPVDRSQIS